MAAEAARQIGKPCHEVHSSLVAYGYGGHFAISSGACAGRLCQGRTSRVAASRIHMDRQPQVVWFVGLWGAGRHVRVAWRSRLGRKTAHGQLHTRGCPYVFRCGAAHYCKPIQTYHPYEALYDWPLFVGKSWPSEFQLKNLDRNQTLDLKYVFTVEAREEVTVPAGTFKTLRILRTSPNDRYVVWYEPKLGLEVKRDWERYGTHPFGIGTPVWHRHAPDGNALLQHQELMLASAVVARRVPARHCFADRTSNTKWGQWPPSGRRLSLYRGSLAHNSGHWGV